MPTELLTHNGRKLYRSVPAGAIKVSDKAGRGVAYVYPAHVGTYLVVKAFAGNAGKPSFWYRYKNQQAASDAIRQFFANLAAHAKLVEERRAKANDGHNFKVDDIITNSWGYEQTNVDWYRITRTSRTFVWLKPIHSVQVEATGPMQATVVAKLSVEGDDPAKWGTVDGDGPEEKHKASGDYITFRFGCGAKWDGRPMHESWYA